MTGTSFNSELAAILEERNHLTILLNLTENGGLSDVLELDARRDRLNNSNVALKLPRKILGEHELATMISRSLPVKANDIRASQSCAEVYRVRLGPRQISVR